jgi:methylation protein EvaC
MPHTCQICGGALEEFLDLGQQPLSDAFLSEHDLKDEFRYRLAVGACSSCTMVQLVEEVPREKMFHTDYPYYSSGSSVMRAHFQRTARTLLAAAGPDPFVVEIGSNDGVLLQTVHDAGARHLGFEDKSVLRFEDVGERRKIAHAIGGGAVDAGLGCRIIESSVHGS